MKVESFLGINVFFLKRKKRHLELFCAYKKKPFETKNLQQTAGLRRDKTTKKFMMFAKK